MVNGDDPAALAKRLYARLIDPGVTDFDSKLELPDTSTNAGELSDLLKNRFRESPAPRAIMIRVGGSDVGVSTPTKVYGADGYAGPDPGGLGSAERAELPGRSTQYRVIVFRCNKCRENSYFSYYDPRRIPDCPVKGHGTMKLQR